VEPAEALRIAILFVGWPGMALVTGFVLWQAWQFHLKVKGSPVGRLVLLMVVGWTMSIGFLAFLATLYLQANPHGSGPLVAGFLAFWSTSMGLVVWIMHRWGAEAVSINLYYAELASMDKVKTDLINTVAHELNTPLTPIALKMGLLKDGRFGELNAEQAKVIESIQRNLERLSGLVDQIVLSTQIQTGRLHPVVAPVDVRAWLKEEAGRFAALAKEQGRPFSVRCDTGTTVPMDRSRVSRVLAGLLDNAFRYSKPTDGVEVAAAAAGDRVVVQVRDAGLGFTPEQATLLFKPMRHPHDPHALAEAGAGLSLFVAKGIVEAHGGSIWASSLGPGRGATFGFSLPLRPTPRDGA
jgi:signal transduction histidine kinase